MTLWALNIIDEGKLDMDDSNTYCMWTRAYSFLIRAPDEKTARAMAVVGSDPEYPDKDTWWLEPELTTCVPVTIEGPMEIILEGHPTG